MGYPSSNLDSMGWVAIYAMNYAVVNHKAHVMGHLWSLSIEEQFYFFYPLFLIFVRPKKFRSLLFIGYFVAVAFFIRPLFYVVADNINLTRFSTVVKIDSIMIGCLIYYMSTTRWFRELRPQKLIKNRIVINLLAVPAFYLATIFLPMAISHPTVSLVGGLLVFLAAFEKDIVIPTGGLSPVMDWLGKRSYIIYVLQLPCFNLTNEIWFRFHRAFDFQLDRTYAIPMQVTAFGLIFGLTELTHRLVEKPFMTRGHLISKGIEERALDSHQNLVPKASELRTG
jgi:peptidoglycan/LPS O-acetylase OafA/YrhL